MTTQQINDLFEQIDSMMFGPEERALITEAVNLAVEAGDEELEYRARIRLTSSAMHSGDTDTMLSSFAWCLAKYDSDPVRFPSDLGNNGADLLWQYKWMSSALGGSPIFPRSDIDAVLADMREHYQRAGIGMSGVLMAQFEDAWASGRIDEAEALRVALEATPRDDHSHCDACTRSEAAGFLAETGREEQALALVEEMLEGGFQCGDEPEFALSRALLPYLRAGRLDEAKSAHLRSYRLARDNPDKISIIANHLVFCAVTGNGARGLAMLERHIGWLSHDTLNVAGHFEILVACGVLLDSIAAAGHGDIPVRGADAASLQPLFGEHDGAWSVADLARASWTAAERIGAAFDARNGNDYFARTIQRAHALESEHFDVPISTDTFVPAPVSVADPTDGPGWLVRARELATLGDAERTASAARKAIEGTTGIDRDGAWSLLIGSLIRLEQWDEAEAAIASRGESLIESGRSEQAALEARHGLALFGRNTQEDRAGLEQELTTADALPSDVRADIELSLAFAQMSDPEPNVDRILELAAAAVADFDQPHAKVGLALALVFQSQVAAMNGHLELARSAVDRLLALDADRATLANAHVLRARLLGGQNEFAQGAQDADAAVRLFLALDAPAFAANASSIAAALLDDAGDFAPALERYRFAVRQSELIDAPSTGIRFSYGRSLVRAGDAAAAVEILTGVFDDETEADAPDAARAESLYWLGHAFAQDAQHGSALGAWKSSLELFVSGGDEQGAAKSGVAAGKLLDRFGEHAEAAELLAAAVERARLTPENLELLTSSLHALGAAKANLSDASGLESLDEVLAIAEEHGATWLAADVTDSKARALLALGRADESIPLALVAADRYLAAGDASSAGGSELFVARHLANSGDPAEAAAIFANALEHAAGHPQLESIIALEYGDVLEGLGRTDEAAAVRARGGA